MTKDAGSARRQAAAEIERALREAEAEYEQPAEGHYVVSLPGTRKLATACSLLLGDHTLSVNAFVVRSADENHEAVYRWMLERNMKMFGMAFALDAVGDIFLDARLPLSVVSVEEVDRLLGSVLSYADESFNVLLELGFASSIRKEWEWRIANGESTANLEAFRGWLEAGPAES